MKAKKLDIPLQLRYMKKIIIGILKLVRLLAGPLLRNKYLEPRLRFLRWKLRHIIPMGRTAIIALTYNCQCSCDHCVTAKYKKRGESELTTDEFMMIIDKLPEIGVNMVSFFGGEPLLRRDLLALIKYSKQRGLKVQLETNGYLLTAKLAKELKNAGLDTVGVSIDSSDRDVHDRWRGVKGSFDQAVEAIRNSLDEGIECYISTFATRENLKNDDLEAIISLGKRLKVDRVRITYPIMAGNWLRADEVKLSPDEEEEVKALTDWDFVFLLHYWPGDPHFYCDSSERMLIYLSCYGDVQPCFAIPLSFGNVKEEPLKVIVRRMWAYPLSERNLEVCPMNDAQFRQNYLPNVVSRNDLPIRYDEIARLKSEKNKQSSKFS